MEKEKTQAVGSIWNVNSWHWQMKNYSIPAKKILEEKFLELTYKPSPDLIITHKKIQFTKAECEINVRKGKPILVFDFQLSLTIKGEHQSEDDSQGSYQVRQILSDDLKDMIVDEVKAVQKNKTGQEMKKWIKKNAKSQIIQIFKHLQEQLLKKEADPTKLEEDRRRRQENLINTQKAREQKGAEKQRLLEQQKEKEKKMKQQAYLNKKSSQ